MFYVHGPLGSCGHRLGEQFGPPCEGALHKGDRTDRPMKPNRWGRAERKPSPYDQSTTGLKGCDHTRAPEHS